MWVCSLDTRVRKNLCDEVSLERGKETSYVKKPGRSFQAHSLGQLSTSEEGDTAACLNEARLAGINRMGVWYL